MQAAPRGPARGGRISSHGWLGSKLTSTSDDRTVGFASSGTIDLPSLLLVKNFHTQSCPPSPAGSRISTSTSRVCRSSLAGALSVSPQRTRRSFAICTSHMTALPKPTGAVTSAMQSASSAAWLTALAKEQEETCLITHVAIGSPLPGDHSAAAAAVGAEQQRLHTKSSSVSPTRPCSQCDALADVFRYCASLSPPSSPNPAREKGACSVGILQSVHASQSESAQMGCKMQTQSRDKVLSFTRQTSSGQFKEETAEIGQAPISAASFRSTQNPSPAAVGLATEDMLCSWDACSDLVSLREQKGMHPKAPTNELPATGLSLGCMHYCAFRDTKDCVLASVVLPVRTGMAAAYKRVFFLLPFTFHPEYLSAVACRIRDLKDALLMTLR